MVVKKIRSEMKNQKVNYVLNDFTDSITLEVPYLNSEIDDFEGVHEILRTAHIEIKDQAKADVIRKFFEKQSLNITYKNNNYNLDVFLREDFDMFLQIYENDIKAVNTEDDVLDLE